MRLPESWSSTFSGNDAVLNHRTEKVCLDNAFVLIEGHPPIHGHTRVCRPPSCRVIFRVSILAVFTKVRWLKITSLHTNFSANFDDARLTDSLNCAEFGQDLCRNFVVHVDDADGLC